MSQCPCGSGKPLDQCCGPIIDGGPAASPEALMRSRYSAYVVQKIDHLERTIAAESRSDHDREAADNWAKSVEWLGLEVLSTSGGGEGQDQGTVEFIARFRHGGMDQAHHETGNFRRDGASWVYVDGKTHNKPLVRSQPKVGRNDPCTCGSGKKYKQCCGR